jgi:hypothetical protein
MKRPCQRLLRICLLAGLIGATSCSRQPPDTAATSAAGAPLVKPQSADSARATEQIVTGEFAAGGAAATAYRATFRDGKLQRITEQHGDAASGQRAEYEFYGARLMKYSGGPVSGTAAGAAIELEFNLQGALVKARAGGANEVPAGQIDEIKTRAQLLRSHALALQATQAH